MFDKYVKMVYNKTIETVKKLNSIDEEIRKLYADQKAERITSKVAEEKTFELKNQVPAIHQEYGASIKEIQKQFDKAVTDFYRIDGSKVHEDAKIFDFDNIVLSEAQLEELVKKHHENSFMIQVIADYCNRKKIFISLPLSEKARREKFEQYIRDASYCVFSPYALKVSFFENGDYDPHIDDDFPADPEE